MTNAKGPLLSQGRPVRSLDNQTQEFVPHSHDVQTTRDHAEIRQWAESRRAEPATGEATRSGPATISVNDGGTGLRFNFPAAGRFRTITWEEWFEHFDRESLMFVHETANDGEPPSYRYRLVKADGASHDAGLLRKLLDRIGGA